jgi:hypothetical protein
VISSTNTFCLCALLATQIAVLPTEVVAEVTAYFRVLSKWLTTVLENGCTRGSFILFRVPGDEGGEVHGRRSRGDAVRSRVRGPEDLRPDQFYFLVSAVWLVVSDARHRHGSGPYVSSGSRQPIVVDDE